LKQTNGESSETSLEKPIRKETEVDSEIQVDPKPKSWPLENQDIIDQLREENTKMEKEMFNYKYLSTIGEKDYRRVTDKLKIADNDLVFLKDSKLFFIIR
jgi:predicted restriction endonuclease